jgi:hypothetical protein
VRPSSTQPALWTPLMPPPKSEEAISPSWRRQEHCPSRSKGSIDEVPQRWDVEPPLVYDLNLCGSSSLWLSGNKHARMQNEAQTLIEPLFAMHDAF